MGCVNNLPSMIDVLMCLNVYFFQMCEFFLALFNFSIHRFNFESRFIDLLAMYLKSKKNLKNLWSKVTVTSRDQKRKMN